MKTFEPNKTITELGIDTTREFVVVVDNEYSYFKKWDILILEHDDDTKCPRFRRKSDWDTWYYVLYRLYYADEFTEWEEVYVSSVSIEDALKCKEKRIYLTTLHWNVNGGNNLVVLKWDEKKYKNWEKYEFITFKYIAKIPKEETIKIKTTSWDEVEITKENLEKAWFKFNSLS